LQKSHAEGLAVTSLHQFSFAHTHFYHALEVTLYSFLLFLKSFGKAKRTTVKTL